MTPPKIAQHRGSAEDSPDPDVMAPKSRNSEGSRHIHQRNGDERDRDEDQVPDLRVRVSERDRVGCRNAERQPQEEVDATA